jgi:hypothetical protein
MTIQDFKDIRFNPLGQERTWIWEQYPELASRQDLCQVPVELDRKERGDPSKLTWNMGGAPNERDLDSLVRYVILYATRKDNPLAREKDFKHRQRLCFDLLGIRPEDRVRTYIEGWHPWVVRVLAVFLRLLDDRMYADWVVAMIAYAQDQEYLMLDPAQVEDAEKLMNTKDKIRNSRERRSKELETLEAKLFQNDDDLRSAVSQMEVGVFDGQGSFAEYVVAKAWNGFV